MIQWAREHNEEGMCALKALLSQWSLSEEMALA